MRVTARALVAALAALSATATASALQGGTRIGIQPEGPAARGFPVLLSATATASSTGAAGGPERAVDGNLGTRWESQFNIDPSWLRLDLGSPYALSSTTIHWEAANAGTYNVEGSNDGVNWDVIKTRTGGLFGDRTDRMRLSGVYRYVRMNGLTRSPGNVYGYSIWEMKVWGSEPLDTDGDGVDNTQDQCPGTPAGSIVDANGCPIVDTDGDGVVDSADLCPGTPAGSTVDANGCVVVVPVLEVSFANGILVAGSGSPAPGHSLYVSNADLAAPGTSTCVGACETNWPPLLVGDGIASGVPDLDTIQRPDGSLQATYLGRPLYRFSGDATPGETLGQGAGGNWFLVPYTQVYVPLYDPSTVLEPELQEDTPTALITRLADRARDRHAREDQFKAYDHYLTFYWEHRTAAIEIVDTIGRGGNTITFNVAAEWQLNPTEAELRFFYRGINTVAEYHNNGTMSAVPSLDQPGSNVRHYTRSLNFNSKTLQPLQVGDRLEFELSHFLNGVPNGRNNYYGTAILYVVGEGVVPWEARGVFGNGSTEREDSYPMPMAGRLGGNTTLPYQYSDEPDNHFMQMSTNLSNINGQVFVRGRRVHHTDFGNGAHDESTGNPVFGALANKLGPSYSNRSCVGCHDRNGRALPANPGQSLDKYLVKVGDALGLEDPLLGRVLQGQSTVGAPEATAILTSWTENNGLRSPNYAFTGVTPTNFRTSIAPQLVGMGLLEAIDEADIEALADPNDVNGDGISGRMSLVTDPLTGQARLGRFGWKASEATVEFQVAAALNTDLGVMTSVRPDPDCGPAQGSCGSSGSELDDSYLQDLTAYVALLGVSGRRDVADPNALAGEALFSAIGCASCHIPSFETSEYAPHAELRSQTIHPYTDLLVHDMGPGLASTLVEHGVEATEWRTAPLWNVGLSAGVSGGASFLHDGRARTLTEAIRWHGGEADGARAAFEALPAADQAKVIAFLNSL